MSKRLAKGKPSRGEFLPDSLLSSNHRIREAHHSADLIDTPENILTHILYFLDKTEDLTNAERIPTQTTQKLTPDIKVHLSLIPRWKKEMKKFHFDYRDSQTHSHREYQLLIEVYHLASSKSWFSHCPELCMSNTATPYLPYDIALETHMLNEWEKTKQKLIDIMFARSVPPLLESWKKRLINTDSTITQDITSEAELEAVDKATQALVKAYKGKLFKRQFDRHTPTFHIDHPEKKSNDFQLNPLIIGWDTPVEDLRQLMKAADQHYSVIEN
ncbi:hypothetical protein PROFUN_06490 [Planoprotostelium fungivorum]|uniref:F-box domain-containing protein n=1 Tax=Planoprotostelium fungivorum TaxID=1890364 RepID=A0A2P6NNY5_9EUKA|nr:hypothetical protein PROFUN_06490 [Planoprotostelium fungivorum]